MHNLCQQISGLHQHSLHALCFIPGTVIDRVLLPLGFQTICDTAWVVFGLFCISPHLLRQVLLRCHVSHFCDATILWSLSTLIPVKFWLCEKRERKHHGQSISLALLTGSALADSLLHVVGCNCCSLLFLSWIHHWLCRCCCLSLLGISVQVTDLQVLLETGYWTRQTSALTQYFCSYDSLSICLISGIYQLEGKKTENLLFLFTRAQTAFFFFQLDGFQGVLQKQMDKKLRHTHLQANKWQRCQCD